MFGTVSASTPELSLNNVLLLRGGAVSLSREAHKSQRKLDQLQRDRRAGAQLQAAVVREDRAADVPAVVQQPQVRVKVDNAVDSVESVREAMQTAVPAAGKGGGKSWAQRFQKRETAKRIAENLRKNVAKHSAHLGAAGGQMAGITAG